MAKFLGLPWDSHGDSHEYGNGMAAETTTNSHKLTGILCGFLYRSEIQWKRFKYGINVIADV